MCGIVGAVKATQLFGPSLADAVNSISHRGPDGQGYFHDGNIHLGMCRLAIIDLQTGDQPGFSESQDAIVVFNGEIYNHAELRRVLVQRGYRFKTNSEAEVIANLYVEYGERFVEKLNGMFSIAVWDSGEKTLFLYRDRVGEKPLWYSVERDSFFFASEIKALLKFGVSKEVDFSSVIYALQYGYVPVGKSPFSAIKQVEPGTYISYQNSKVRVERYSEWETVTSDCQRFEDSYHEVRRLLFDSIELRLNSERELGVFLSGGIDSSIVAGICRSLVGPKLKTFSAGFENSQFDESKHAEKVARELNTEHRTIMISPSPAVLIDEISKFADQPFSDSSIIPSYLLAKEARKHVVVALGGDGGDEVFGGYDRYRAILRLRKLRMRLPQIPANTHSIPYMNQKAFRLYRCLTEGGSMARYDSLLRNINPEVLSLLWQESVFTENIQSKVWVGEANELIRKVQIRDLVNYLPGDLMYKSDLATMATGLELRSPFLDHRIIQFGLGLHCVDKVSWSRGKKILRKLVREFVPGDTTTRAKQGFAIPRAEWLRGSMKELASDLLFGESTIRRGWVDTNELKRLFNINLKGRDQDRILWPFLTLELWARSWIDSSN